MRPYLQLLRLHAPIGIWLLVLPALWAVGLAAPLADMPRLMALMLLGAFLTRAAGCIINDLTDRRLDARVERTRTRPLAAGTVPVSHAVGLLILLLALALWLALQLPVAVFYVALVAVPMITAYPWMKRLTGWPQLFLGLTFNLSAPMGWLASGAPLEASALLLYGASVLWTLGYDTIYAVQDMSDDAIVGIRSSARTLGLTRLRPFIAGCYGGMLLALGAMGLMQSLAGFYWVGLALAALHASWQVRALPCSPARAGKLFRSNAWLGLMVLVGILASRLL